MEISDNYPKNLKIRYSPANEPILSSLVDAREKLVYYGGRSLLRKVVNEPYVKAIVVIGKSGAGKTSLLGDLAAAVKRIGQTNLIEFNTQRLSYDQFYQNAFYEFGPTENWPIEFNPVLGRWIREPSFKLSQSFLKTILNSPFLTESSSANIRNLLLIEFPGLEGENGETPLTALKDRASTTLDGLIDYAFEKIKSTGKSPLTFVGLYAHPAIQRQANAMRHLVANKKDEDVLDLIKQRFNITVLGLENLSLAERGRLLKEQFKWAPSKHHLELMNKEIDDYALNLLLKLGQRKIFNNVWLHQSPSDEANYEIAQLGRTGFVLNHRFEQTNLPSNTWRILYNRFQPNLPKFFYFENLD